MGERADIWRIADQLQMDLRAASAKLVELRAHLSALSLPEAAAWRCPTCGLPTKGPNTLAEHVHVSHGGPVPGPWLIADELAGEARLVAEGGRIDGVDEEVGEE